MKQIRTVARRELRSYFDYPTAYILVVAFLALSIFLTLRTISEQRAATMRPFFDLLPWMFALFVPAITMRSLAEERRIKTLEWLMAQPLDEKDVIIGKFLGNWLFILIAIAGSIPAAVGILMISDADSGIMFAQYLGAALLAGELVALGMWSSSVTRNQITAFILAASLSLVLVLIGMPVVYNALPVVIGGMVAKFSVLPHVQNISRGTLDFRDVLYFFSTAALFLLLAGVSLARERLSLGRGAYRRVKVAAIVGLVAVIVLNLIGGYLNLRLDLTRDRIFTLAPGTRDILESLDERVQVKLFVSADLPPPTQLSLRDVRDLLSDMQSVAGENLQVIERNPARSDAVREDASSLGVTETSFNAMRGDELLIKRGWFGIAVQYLDQWRVIPIVDRTDDLEYRISSFISSLTSPVKAKVAFATGFGMKGPDSLPLLAGLTADRYQVGSIAVDDSLLPPISPDSIRIVIVAAPDRAMSARALGTLQQYVDNGGSLLILHENSLPNPSIPGTRGRVDSRIGVLLNRMGVGFQFGMVFDMRNAPMVSLPDRPVNVRMPLWPITSRASDHPIMSGIDNVTMAWASPLIVIDSTRVTPLLRTSDATGLRPEASDPMEFDIQPQSNDTLRQRILAVAVEDKVSASDSLGAAAPARAGRMVVVGDADFLDMDLASNNPNNAEFGAHAIDWLAQEEVLLRIRSKNRVPPSLIFESDSTLFLFKYGNLAGVPLLFALVGAWRITTRRRRARKRWGGVYGEAQSGEARAANTQDEKAGRDASAKKSKP